MTPAPSLDVCDLDRQDRAARRAFWLLAGLHLVLWTLVPLAVQPVAPLDMVEMRYWGHQWQLGYHKHPPLPGWIAEAASVASGGHFLGVYLASQLGIVACLWAVWRLGRDLLSPWLAFLGAFLVQTLYWCTMGSVEYNNNVGMFPFWALAILFLYWALKNPPSATASRGAGAGPAPGVGQLRWWLATGAMLGLGMLCKYSMAVLAITVFLFLVAHPTARRAWRRPGPYLMILVAVLLFSPHLIWAVTHGMPSLGYASTRTLGGPRLLGHLACPLEFIGSQLLVLLPTAIAIVPLAGFRWRLRQLPPTERFARAFLLAMVLGPCAVQLLMAGVCNIWLLSAYGSQLWMFAGLTLLYCLAIRPTDRAICYTAIRCAIIGIAFLAAGAIHNIAAPYGAHEALRTHCPSPTLAAKVHEVWNRRYREPLPVIAGDWWLAANVAFYGPTIPVIYGSSEFNRVDMSPCSSGWTDDAYLCKHGGVIVWNATACLGDPRAEVHRRFPTAEFLDPISIRWQTGANIPPLQVGLAVVPPP